MSVLKTVVSSAIFIASQITTNAQLETCNPIHSNLLLCENMEQGHIMEFNDNAVCPELYHICDSNDLETIIPFTQKYVSYSRNVEQMFESYSRTFGFQTIHEFLDHPQFSSIEPIRYIKEIAGCFATKISDSEYDCIDCIGDDIENNNMIVLGNCVLEQERSLQELDFQSLLQEFLSNSQCCSLEISQQPECVQQNLIQYITENRLEQYQCSAALEREQTIINCLDNTCVGDQCGFSFPLNCQTEPLPSRDPLPSSDAKPSMSPDVLPSRDPLPSSELRPSMSPDVLPSRDPLPSNEARPSMSPDVLPSRDPLPSNEARPSMSPDVLPSKEPLPSNEARPSMSPDVLPSKEPLPSNEARPSMSPDVLPSRDPLPSSEPLFCRLENGRIVPNYWSGLLNECVFCQCRNGDVSCRSRCQDEDNTISEPEPTSRPLPTRPPTNTKPNCLGFPNTYFPNVRRNECRKTQNINGFACCRNKCSLPNCNSCKGNICNSCQDGFQLVKLNDYTTQCVPFRPTPITQGNETSNINSTQPTSEMDEREISLHVCSENQYAIRHGRHIECLDCVHGHIEENMCVCHDGFFGRHCEMECRFQMCSGRGECPQQTSRRIIHKCDCDESFFGPKCEYQENKPQCMYGIYEDETESCICDYGFTGELCEERIRCDNGRIIDDKCICQEGYSGKFCHVKRPSSREQQTRFNEILTRQQEKSCEYGISHKNPNSTQSQCVCLNGWMGERCDEPMCLNGIYNITSDSCDCFLDWTGQKCDTHCRKSCNYKGTICNADFTCQCVNGWNGALCGEKIIEKRQKQTIEISDDIHIDIVLNITKDELKPTLGLTECFDFNCLPIRLDIVNTSKISLRRLQNSDSDTQNSDSFEIVLDPTLVNENQSVIVYETAPNMNTTEYLFDSNIVQIDNTNEATYLFYVTERTIIQEVSVSPQPSNIIAPSVSPIVNSSPSYIPSATPSPTQYMTYPSSAPSSLPTPSATPSSDLLIDEQTTTDENTESETDSKNDPIMLIGIGVGVFALIVVGSMITYFRLNHTNSQTNSNKLYDKKTKFVHNPLQSKV
jgi:hypothetical protein